MVFIVKSANFYNMDNNLSNSPIVFIFCSFPFLLRSSVQRCHVLLKDIALLPSLALDGIY